MAQQQMDQQQLALDMNEPVQLAWDDPALSMLKRLSLLATAGRLRQLDYQFARFIAARDGRDEVVLAAALVSYQLGLGNVCLVLDKVVSMPLFGLADWEVLSLRRGLSLARLGEVLADSPTVGDGAPLRLDDGRLYLSRYWHYEQQVAISLKKAAADSWQGDLGASLDRLFARDYQLIFSALTASRENQFNVQRFVEKFLDLQFPERVDWPAVDALLMSADSPGALRLLEQLVPLSLCLNWQKVAAAMAASRRFAVISGGPGTGKTTTVTKLLALLVEQHRQSQQGEALPLTIKLVAPTGKAAARLTESIGGAKQQLALAPDIAAQIPEQAGTIHRLLGVIPNRQAFRHHRGNPLHLDLLVVDEASMVDLPLMARLLDALPPKARLILLGDKDQLSSVEAGSVLGDICHFAEGGYGREQANWLGQVTHHDLTPFAAPEGSAIGDSLCLLRKSYRFDAQSGIGNLARAINGGDPKAVEAVWQDDFTDISLHGLGEQVYRDLLRLAVAGYRDYLQLVCDVRSPEAARPIIEAFNRFQILCALREGDFGVSGINEQVERALSKESLIRKGGREWYAGRPVMISQNDHALGLYNGDIGITLMTAESGGESRARVYFQMADGEIRSFLPSRLPAHDTVYAMTVHKSQGSEFAHTVMVLPKQDSPLLTRELVYTGVTRAKKRLDIFAHPGILSRAVKRRTERASGLAQLLAG